MIWLFTAISLVFGWFALRDVDWDLFLASFSLLDPSWFAGFVLCMLIMVHLRTLRWERMIRPLIPPDFNRRTLRLTSWIGFAAVILFPLRAGELVRPAFFRGKPGHSSFGPVFGALLVERVLDGLWIVLAIASAFAWRFFRDDFSVPAWALGIWGITSLIFLVMLGVLIFIAKAPESAWPGLFRLTGLPMLARRFVFAQRLNAELERITGRLALGLKSSLASHHLSAAVAYTFGYWGANAVGILLLARAFGLPAGPDSALLVLGFSAVGVFIPGAPGHVGNFHEFARLGLSTRFSSAMVTGPGMAFVVTLHAVQTFLYLGLGLFGLMALPPDLRKWKKKG
ncbi:flippase-like domain-containing protein [Myxococcota bacterium]|nr:flippase-like domain-containing protein [Myxococcota bacterium]